MRIVYLNQLINNVDHDDDNQVEALQWQAERVWAGIQNLIQSNCFVKLKKKKAATEFE